MSRRVKARWELTGYLVAETPVHVGGAEGDRLAGVARDGLDRPVLPGTSLAGVIQAALSEPERGLWQPTEPGRPGRDDTHLASWVRVDDAPACDPVSVETRDHVSIDRRTGAAAAGHLFTREVVAPGTRFAFRMVVEDDGASPAPELARRVLSLLSGPGVRVGAAGSTGLGLVRLVEPRLRRWDLATRAGLLATLRGQGQVFPIREQAEECPPTADEWPTHLLRITIRWRPRGPLGVQVAAEGEVVDAFPRTTSTPDGVRLELPGSSIKGVLRSHAERIVRTVAGRRAPEEFLAQMRAEGLGPVADLFGTAKDRVSGGENRHGALTVHPCLSRAALPLGLWQKVRRPPGVGPDGSAPPLDPSAALAAMQRAVQDLNQVAAAGELWFTVAHHVAVDRWTGGAADARLFAVLEAHATGPDAWQPMVLDLDWRRLRDRPLPALALLLLVLRDLCDGWVGFGHATTRGMGGVVVDRAEVTFQAGTAVGEPLSGRSLADLLDDPDLTKRVTEAWTTTMTGGAG